MVDRSAKAAGKRLCNWNRKHVGALQTFRVGTNVTPAAGAVYIRRVRYMVYNVCTECARLYETESE